MNCGIYEIRNMITNDIYIGQSINLRHRKEHHFSKLKLNKHDNQHLQNVYNKYGKNNLIFKTLIYCDPINLTVFEQIFVNNLKPKYNKQVTCVESRRGMKCSDELKLKYSKARLGKHLSEEAKLKLSRLYKGKRKPDGFSQKLSDAKKGHTVSEETRKKISNTLKNRNIK